MNSDAEENMFSFDIKPGTIIQVEDLTCVYVRSFQYKGEEIPIFLKHNVDVSTNKITPFPFFEENFIKYDVIFDKLEKYFSSPGNTPFKISYPALEPFTSVNSLGFSDVINFEVNRNIITFFTLAAHIDGNIFIKTFNTDYDNNKIKILKVIQTFCDGVVVTPNFSNPEDEKFWIYIPKKICEGAITVTENFEKEDIDNIFEKYFQNFISSLKIRIFDDIEMKSIDGIFAKVTGIWKKVDRFTNFIRIIFQFDGQFKGCCDITSIKSIRKNDPQIGVSKIPDGRNVFGKFKISDYYLDGAVISIKEGPIEGHIFQTYENLIFFDVIHSSNPEILYPPNFYQRS